MSFYKELSYKGVLLVVYRLMCLLMIVGLVIAVMFVMIELFWFLRNNIHFVNKENPYLKENLCFLMI